MAQNEDVYAVELTDGRNELGDYRNEFVPLYLEPVIRRGGDGEGPLEETRKIMRDFPIQTLEERYLTPGGHNYYPLADGSGLRFWQEYITRHPGKIERLNRCVAIMNACETLVLFRRAANEALRLIGGKDAELWFTGEEDHPDKLEM